jgi:hypothetical protein
VTGHQDDGSVVVICQQFALEFQSIHSGHADVGHDAARLRPRPGVQERHRRLVHLHGKVRRLQCVRPVRLWPVSPEVAIRNGNHSHSRLGFGL